MNLSNKLVAQLVSYPMGGLWAQFMPRIQILGVSLNPGPFTIKEHVGTDSFHLGIFSASAQVLITIMAGVGSESAYAVGGTTCKRNPSGLMADLYRRILSPYNGCCINKPGVSHVREEDLAAISFNAHRPQINGYWSCRPNLLGYRPAESRGDCSSHHHL